MDEQFYSHRRASDNVAGVSENTIVKTLDRRFYETIRKELITFVGPNDEVLLDVATNICAEFAKRKCYHNFLVKKVAVWVAKKLIRSNIKEQQIPNSGRGYTDKEILEVELSICNTLNYKLH